jgi:hypothetical protein
MIGRLVKGSLSLGIRIANFLDRLLEVPVRFFFFVPSDFCLAPKRCGGLRGPIVGIHLRGKVCAHALVWGTD